MKERYPLRKEPQQKRSKRLYERILQAAEEVLIRLGYGAFTSNTVAEEAGISIGSVYQYFPDKKTIVIHMLDSKITAVHAGIRAELEKIDTSLTLLEFTSRAMEIGLLAWEREPVFSTLSKLSEFDISHDIELWVEEFISIFIIEYNVEQRQPSPLALRLICESIAHIVVKHAIEGKSEIPKTILARLAADMITRFLFETPDKSVAALTKP
ncbi:MAG: TetR/AcrR family transcriptional regulator [Candidatus Thiodiazotropha sp.]